MSLYQIIFCVKRRYGTKKFCPEAFNSLKDGFERIFEIFKENSTNFLTDHGNRNKGIHIYETQEFYDIYNIKEVLLPKIQEIIKLNKRKNIESMYVKFNNVERENNFLTIKYRNIKICLFSTIYMG